MVAIGNKIAHPIFVCYNRKEHAKKEARKHASSPALPTEHSSVHSLILFFLCQKTITIAQQASATIKGGKGKVGSPLLLNKTSSYTPLAYLSTNTQQYTKATTKGSFYPTAIDKFDMCMREKVQENIHGQIHTGRTQMSVRENEGGLSLLK